jgi:hypothetical protein
VATAPVVEAAPAAPSEQTPVVTAPALRANTKRKRTEPIEPIEPTEPRQADSPKRRRRDEEEPATIDEERIEDEEAALRADLELDLEDGDELGEGEDGFGNMEFERLSDEDEDDSDEDEEVYFD